MEVMFRKLSTNIKLIGDLKTAVLSFFSSFHVYHIN